MPLQGQPRRRAPLQRPPSPRDALAQLQAATLRSRLPGWVSGSLRGSRERARPHPRPRHSRAHTPARARPHTRAHAQHTGATDRLSAQASGDAAGLPPRALSSAFPPRPAPLELASPGAAPWAAKFAARSSRGRAPARAQLGSTLHGTAVNAGPAAWILCAQRCCREPNLLPRFWPTRGVRVPQGHSSRRRGAQPTLSLPYLSSWAQTLHHHHSAMAPGPGRISLGSQLLPMVPLLLLLRGAGCSHKSPSWSSLPSATDGLQGDKDPQLSPGDTATALGSGAQDMVAVHMLRLYEKYNQRGARPGGGNTVRSFRARLGK